MKDTWGNVDTGAGHYIKERVEYKDTHQNREHVGWMRHRNGKG